MSGQKGTFHLAQLPGWEKPQGAGFIPPESSAILSPPGPLTFKVTSDSGDPLKFPQEKRHVG